MSKVTKIRLQTIQPLNFWKRLQAQGIISGDHKIIEKQIHKEFNKCSEQEQFGGFLSSYKWLENKMRDLGILDLEQHSAPIFAWCQFTDSRHKKADLRQCRNYINKGQQGVRITFDLPLNRVLLSDFDDWHYVLNNSPAIDVSNDEWDKLDQQAIIDSWDNIFYKNEDYLNNKYYDKSIQATCFNIRLDDVVKVEFFDN